MRDEKEERKKQARSNKQTRQSNTAHVHVYAHSWPGPNREPTCTSGHSPYVCPQVTHMLVIMKKLSGSCRYIWGGQYRFMGHTILFYGADNIVVWGGQYRYIGWTILSYGEDSIIVWGGQYHFMGRTVSLYGADNIIEWDGQYRCMGVRLVLCSVFSSHSPVEG